MGEGNKRGRDLVGFAAKNNTKIAYTFFKKKEKRKWRWISSDKKRKNEIDHLLINDTPIIKDEGVISNFGFLSDRRPVHHCINILPRAQYRNSILKNCNLKVIIQRSRQEKVNAELGEYLQYIQENRKKEEVTSLYDKLEAGLKEMYKICME